MVALFVEILLSFVWKKNENQNVKSGAVVDKVDTQCCHIFADSPYTSHSNLTHIWNNDKNTCFIPHLYIWNTKRYAPKTDIANAHL